MPRTRNNYPASAAELIDPNKTYKRGVLTAVKIFRRSKPWQGTLKQRQIKFRNLHIDLCAIYFPPDSAQYNRCPSLRFDIPGGVERPTGNGTFNPATLAITLHDKLSVITYLHEFAHALYGADERKAVRWSINLFRRGFPRSWTRLTQDGHCLRTEPTNHSRQMGIAPTGVDTLPAEVRRNYML